MGEVKKIYDQHSAAAQADSDISKQDLEIGESTVLDTTLYETAGRTTTSRGLKSRHIQMIALAGCIGTA